MDKGPQEPRRFQPENGRPPGEPPARSARTCARRRPRFQEPRTRPLTCAGPGGSVLGVPGRCSGSRTSPPHPPSFLSRAPSPPSPGWPVPSDPAATHRAPLTRGLCLQRGARGGPGRAASSPWARAGAGGRGRAPRAPGGRRAASAAPSGSEASRTPSARPLRPCARLWGASRPEGVALATQRGLPGRPGGAGTSRPPPTSLVRHRGSRAGAPCAPPPILCPRPPPAPRSQVGWRSASRQRPRPPQHAAGNARSPGLGEGKWGGDGGPWAARSLRDLSLRWPSLRLVGSARDTPGWTRQFAPDTEKYII